MKQIVHRTKYEAIMVRIDEFIELVDDNTSPIDKKDFLVDLVVAYEKEHYPIGKSEPTLQMARKMHKE
jgi:hypothetical protein